MAAKSAFAGLPLVSLDATASAPPGRHVALVPGAEAPLLALDLPPGLKGAARERVARRQLQDTLGGAGLEMRPFAGGGPDESWSRAIVAETRRVDDWRKRAGKGCRAVLPDYLGLPAASDIWTLSARDGHVSARLGLRDGFSSEAALATELLATELAGAGPKAVLALGDLPQELIALCAQNGVRVYHDAADLARDGLPQPQVFAHGELAMDLRADPQAARARLRRRVLPWRWPLAAGLVAAGLWASGHLIAIQAIEAETARQRAQAVEIARANFVPSGPILDVRAQVSRALADRQARIAEAQAQVSPLTVLSNGAVEVFAAGAEAELVSFGPVNGTTLTIRVADFAALDALLARLAGAGVQAELLDSRAGADETGVRADLRLTEAAK